MDDVVTMELGVDAIQAHLIAEACRAEGMKVELLMMDESTRAVGMAPIVPHKMLVQPGDVERVVEIAADFGVTD